MAFLLTRGKGEQKTAMPRGGGRRKRRAREQSRWTCGGKKTATAKREKSAEVHQKKTREEIEGDCKGNGRGKKRGEKDRENLLLGLRLPRSR